VGPSPSAPTASHLPAPPSNAGTFPDPDSVTWKQVVAGLTSPVDIQFPDDSTGRMFVVEQAGRIRVVENGQLLSTPFLDISDRVESRGNEQGLLGLAFHPRFKDNPIFFVNYTDRDKHDVIARFRLSSDPHRADAGSEVRLISQDDPFPNHNGGVLAFGPDGFLYAGLGDGGGADDVLGSGQNKNTLLGKILRLDVDHGNPYAIPADNPFVAAGGSSEIWAYGLRNPWRISFDRANGDLYIADVGQDTWEEVDFWPAGAPGGANFGWNYREGFHHFAGSPPVALHLISPIAEYSHDEGGCSVTGGFVYRGHLPNWPGIYLYGDYCSGKIWGLLHPPGSSSQAAWPSKVLFETKASITTFGQDLAGEVYFADRSGVIYRLEAAP
jgi:glucose/arabinose dehydrogenase